MLYGVEKNNKANFAGFWRLMDERRKCPRVDISFPVECDVFPGKNYFYTVTKDLSAGGAKILSDNFLPKDHHIKLKINLIDKMLDLRARVAWCNQMRASERYWVGLEFIGLSPQQQKDIGQLLTKVITPAA